MGFKLTGIGARVLGCEGDADATMEGDRVGGEEAMGDASAMEIFHALFRGGKGERGDSNIL